MLRLFPNAREFKGEALDLRRNLVFSDLDFQDDPWYHDLNRSEKKVVILEPFVVPCGMPRPLMEKMIRLKADDYKVGRLILTPLGYTTRQFVHRYRKDRSGGEPLVDLWSYVLSTRSDLMNKIRASLMGGIRSKFFNELADAVLPIVRQLLHDGKTVFGFIPRIIPSCVVVPGLLCCVTSSRCGWQHGFLRELLEDERCDSVIYDSWNYCRVVPCIEGNEKRYRTPYEAITREHFIDIAKEKDLPVIPWQHEYVYTSQRIQRNQVFRIAKVRFDESREKWARSFGLDDDLSAATKQTEKILRWRDLCIWTESFTSMPDRPDVSSLVWCSRPYDPQAYQRTIPHGFGCFIDETDIPSPQTQVKNAVDDLHIDALGSIKRRDMICGGIIEVNSLEAFDRLVSLAAWHDDNKVDQMLEIDEFTRRVVRESKAIWPGTAEAAISLGLRRYAYRVTVIYCLEREMEFLPVFTTGSLKDFVHWSKEIPVVCFNSPEEMKKVFTRHPVCEEKKDDVEAKGCYRGPALYIPEQILDREMDLYVECALSALNARIPIIRSTWVFKSQLPKRIVPHCYRNGYSMKPPKAKVVFSLGWRNLFDRVVPGDPTLYGIAQIGPFLAQPQDILLRRSARSIEDALYKLGGQTLVHISDVNSLLS